METLNVWPHYYHCECCQTHLSLQWASRDIPGVWPHLKSPTWAFNLWKSDKNKIQNLYLKQLAAMSRNNRWNSTYHPSLSNSTVVILRAVTLIKSWERNRWKQIITIRPFLIGNLQQLNNNRGVLYVSNFGKLISTLPRDELGLLLRHVFRRQTAQTQVLVERWMQNSTAAKIKQETGAKREQRIEWEYTNVKTQHVAAIALMCWKNTENVECKC